MTTNTNTNQRNETREETNYVYFVAFQYFTNRGMGFTNVEIPLNRKFSRLEHVQEIEQYLRAEGYNSALVMGFSLLRTETVPTSGRPS